MSAPDNTLDLIKDIKARLDRKVTARKSIQSMTDAQLKQKIINMKISYRNVCMKCNHGVYDAVDLFEKEKENAKSDVDLTKLLLAQQASSPIRLYTTLRSAKPKS